MNAKKNRKVFLISLSIWVIVFYFILDISSFNPESFFYDNNILVAASMEFFMLLMLPLIVTIGYGFLTFNKDDHSIFMDNLEETLEENHRKEMQKLVMKHLDDLDEQQEELQEESVHPLLEWFDGFANRTHFVASIFESVVVVFLSSSVFIASGDFESELFGGVIGAVIGFVLAYIIIWVIELFWGFVLWIIFGK